MTETHPAFTDEALTAFLDGEADTSLRAQIENAMASDAALRARVDALDMSKDVLAAAFAPEHLGAPVMPSELLKAPGAKVRKLVWPAAVAASFALGMVAMQVLQPAPQQAGWVEAVVSYQSLYVTETLDGYEQPDDVLQPILAQAEALLGVSLDAALEIEGLEFKRVQMLALDGAPLVQLAYLDVDGVPFAFCLTPRNAADRDMTTKTSWKLAQSSWVDDGIGFVLVGGQDEDRVGRLSQSLRQRL